MKRRHRRQRRGQGRHQLAPRRLGGRGPAGRLHRLPADLGLGRHLGSAPAAHQQGTSLKIAVQQGDPQRGRVLRQGAEALPASRSSTRPSRSSRSSTRSSRPMPVISDLSKAAGGSRRSRSRPWRRRSTRSRGRQDQAVPRRDQDGQAAPRRVKCDGGDDRAGSMIGSFDAVQGPGGDDDASPPAARTSMIDTKPATDRRHLSAQHGDGRHRGQGHARAADDAGHDLEGQVAEAGLSIPVIEDPTILFELISRRRHPAGRVRQRPALAWASSSRSRSARSTPRRRS